MTIIDIANKAKVSTATVSRVLNGISNKKNPSEKTKNILEIIKTYKYKPSKYAQQLAKKRKTSRKKSNLSLRETLGKIAYTKLRFNLFRKHNFQCVYCGKKPPKTELQIDHKIPISRGGTHKKENLTVSCSHCNRGKGDLILQMYRR